AIEAKIVFLFQPGQALLHLGLRRGLRSRNIPTDVFSVDLVGEASRDLAPERDVQELVAEGFLVVQILAKVRDIVPLDEVEFAFENPGHGLPLWQLPGWHLTRLRLLDVLVDLTEVGRLRVVNPTEVNVPALISSGRNFEKSSVNGLGEGLHLK